MRLIFLLSLICLSFTMKVSGDYACKSRNVTETCCTPKDCNVTLPSVWSDWVKGQCNVECGTGTITSTRYCLQGMCVGEKTIIEKCEKKEVKPVWSDWMKGECTVASGCGKGIRTSTRVCLQGTCVGVKTKTESCGEVLVPGPIWGPWIIGKCSATCGEAVRTDTRTCICGDCEGNTSRNVECNLDPCHWCHDNELKVDEKAEEKTVEEKAEVVDKLEEKPEEEKAEEVEEK